MEKQRINSFFVFLTSLSVGCHGQYKIPEVTFEAFTPKGLRISIPAEQGVELFAFHGKVNKPIQQIEPGEISQDITRSTNDRFVYVDTNIKLKKSDVINYWVYVQHEQLGFRKDDQSWTVERLLPDNLLREEVIVPGCRRKSFSKVEGIENLCSGDNIISYTFSEKPIDSKIWLIEQYIPYEPDWEFNIYQNTPDVIDIENGALRIKPKFIEENAQKEINLSEGCTRKDKECVKNLEGPTWNQPVVSGKLISKTSFCFGNITLRAKLPIGDYSYPELYLQDVNNPMRRILIAYARGNSDYSQGNIDDGGKKLFGGPYSNVIERRGKSKYLSTYQHSKHIGNDWHLFTVIWSPAYINLYMDGNHYGEVKAEGLRATGFNDPKMVRLVIGVGAGGSFEFPDGYTSGGRKKPYDSTSTRALKDFTKNKNTWLDTWTDENTKLQVSYVSITAL